MILCAFVHGYVRAHVEVRGEVSRVHSLLLLPCWSLELIQVLFLGLYLPSYPPPPQPSHYPHLNTDLKQREVNGDA